jgi:L-lactate dehydrogenase complex protein LldG
VNARDAILEAVRRNLPRPAVPLPPAIAPRASDEPLVPRFRRELAALGGAVFDVADAADVRAKVKAMFPEAKVVCSVVPEVAGTRSIESVGDPHELSDVDVGVLRSPLGVAECGAIWLTDTELVVNALGVLAQHLVVLLESKAIVATMHDAYARIAIDASPYGVFMAGPSATADIEGVLVRGAQGARSTTVLLCG